MLEQRYDGTQETLGTAAALTDLRSRLAERDRELHEAWVREAMLREALWHVQEADYPTPCRKPHVIDCTSCIIRAALQAPDAAPLEAIHDLMRELAMYAHKHAPDVQAALDTARRLFGEPENSSSQEGVS